MPLCDRDQIGSDMATDSMAALQIDHTIPTSRAGLIAVGYWLAWVLFFIFYWQQNSPAVDDAFWLQPIVLWLTLSHIPPTTDLCRATRILAIALAVSALGQMAYLTYIKLNSVAEAFPMAPGHRILNLWSIPARMLAAAFLTSMLLAPSIVRAFGARGARSFSALLLVCSVVDLLDSLLSLDRWVSRPISNLLLMHAAIAPPLVLGVICHIVGQRRKSVVTWLKSMVPEYFHRFWHGRASLLVTEVIYVIAFGTVGGLFFFRMGVSDYWVRGPVQDIAVLGLWVSMLMILYLASVPAWRAYAHAGTAETKRARVGIVLLASPFVLVTVLLEGPRLGFRLGPLVEQFVGSSWQIRTTTDPTELELRGTLSYGVAEGLLEKLKLYPETTRLRLDSPGGFVNEALQAANAIRERQLDTFVSGECSSACTLIFAAGRERIIGPEAHLGFHSARFDNPFQDRPNESSSKEYLALGIAPDFIRRADRVPAYKMWYPTQAELLTAHVITKVGD